MPIEPACVVDEFRVLRKHKSPRSAKSRELFLTRTPRGSTWIAENGLETEFLDPSGQRLSSTPIKGLKPNERIYQVSPMRLEEKAFHFNVPRVVSATFLLRPMDASHFPRFVEASESWVARWDGQTLTVVPHELKEKDALRISPGGLWIYGKQLRFGWQNSSHVRAPIDPATSNVRMELLERWSGPPEGTRNKELDELVPVAVLDDGTVFFRTSWFRRCCWVWSPGNSSPRQIHPLSANSFLNDFHLVLPQKADSVLYVTRTSDQFAIRRIERAEIHANESILRMPDWLLDFRDARVQWLLDPAIGSVGFFARLPTKPPLRTSLFHDNNSQTWLFYEARDHETMEVRVHRKSDNLRNECLACLAGQAPVVDKNNPPRAHRLPPSWWKDALPDEESYRVAVGFFDWRLRTETLQTLSKSFFDENK